MKVFQRFAIFACSLPIALAAFADAGAAPKGSGLDFSGFDSGTRFADDLYTAVNGHWLSETKIPDDKEYVFGEAITDRTAARLGEILDSLRTSPAVKGTVAQQVGDLYASYLDLDAIDRRGLRPVQAVFRDIDQARTAKDLADWQGRMQGILQTPVWIQFVLPDLKDPTVNRAYTEQGGLGLPGPEYYLNQDQASFQSARTAYLAYLTELARLIGEKAPGEAAARVFQLEAGLARGFQPATETRDPGSMYNPMTAEQLAAAAPGFDWAAFMGAAGLPQGAPIVVTAPREAKAMAALFASRPLADWKLYFKMRCLDEAAPWLPAAVRQAHFEFHGKNLHGMSAEVGRKESAVAIVNDAMGEPLGHLYVERYFSGEQKSRAAALAGQVLTAAREVVVENTTMSAEAKEAALDKLEKCSVRIGYPDHWRDFAGLEIRRDDGLGNHYRAKKFAWKSLIATAGRKVDRSLWMLTPQTVDAYYDPMSNSINFPAAFLQLPLFDPAADDAFNFGALGSQIGHEISHGFDQFGSQFDGDGQMRDGWQDADRKVFQNASEALAAQYDSFEPLPGKHLDGKATLAENIADLMGLKIAFRAYQDSLHGSPSAVIDGFSGEQRFFLSYAQSKRIKERDEFLLEQISSDMHAPQLYRVNGPVANLAAFQQAFHTAPGDRLYRPEAERIVFW